MWKALPSQNTFSDIQLILQPPKCHSVTCKFFIVQYECDRIFQICRSATCKMLFQKCCWFYYWFLMWQSWLNCYPSATTVQEKVAQVQTHGSMCLNTELSQKWSDGVFIFNSKWICAGKWCIVHCFLFSFSLSPHTYFLSWTPVPEVTLSGQKHTWERDC